MEGGKSCILTSWTTTLNPSTWFIPCELIEKIYIHDPSHNIVLELKEMVMPIQAQFEVESKEILALWDKLFKK